MDRSETIGERVRRLRKAKGWTMGQLSARMGKDNAAYVSKLERGEIQTPTFGTITRLATALGVPDWELTGGTPPPGSSDQDLTRALADTVPPDRVQDLITMIESLDPDDKSLVVDMIKSIYERRERRKAEQRADVQRRRRQAHEEAKEPPEEEKPPEEEGDESPRGEPAAMLVPAGK